MLSKYCEMTLISSNWFILWHTTWNLPSNKRWEMSTLSLCLLASLHFFPWILLSLLLLLLSHFSSVRLCVIPQMAAHQAPLSPGFSRQEYWSGLPFPSPMHGSEKWKWSCSVSVRRFVTPWTTAYQAPPSMGFSRQEYWSGFLVS